MKKTKTLNALSLTISKEGIIINNQKAIEDLIFDKNKPKACKKIAKK